jgi:hypothetical protein
MPERESDRRYQVEEARSASMNAMLGIGAANVVAPFVAPYVHEKIAELRKDDADAKKLILPPGGEKE